MVVHIPRLTACPSFYLCFDGFERQQEHASLLGAQTAYLLQRFWGKGIPSPDLAHSYPAGRRRRHINLPRILGFGKVAK